MAAMIGVNVFAIQRYGFSPAQALHYALTTALMFYLVQGIATALLVLLAAPLKTRLLNEWMS